MTDAKTGAPLESVEVSVDSYQSSEPTNGLGDHELEMAGGTWTLEFRQDSYEPQKVVITEDFIAACEVKDDTKPLTEGPLTVTDDWTEEDTHWFQGEVLVGSSVVYFLFRITDEGNALAIAGPEVSSPTTIDPSSDYYGEWTRQE